MSHQLAEYELKRFEEVLEGNRYNCVSRDPWFREQAIAVCPFSVLFDCLGKKLATGLGQQGDLGPYGWQA